MNNKLTHLTQILDEAFYKKPDHPALIGLGKSMHYDELYNHSICLSNYLSSQVNKGVVGIMMPNILAQPVSLFGAWYADRTVTLINPLYTSTELLKQCLDAQVSTIIVAKVFYKKLAPILKDTKIKYIVTVGIGDFQPFFKRQIVNFTTCLKDKSFRVQKYSQFKYATLNHIVGNYSNKPKTGRFKNKIALLQYTGGTSGTPKPATLRHSNILANINQLEHWLPEDINSDSIILTALPLYHVFALSVNFLLFMHIKGTNVLVLNPRNIKQLIKPIKEYNISVITGVNTLFNVLIRHKDFKKINFSNLKLTVSGGMPLDKKTSDQWQLVAGMPILQGYGLSECSPVVSVEDSQTSEFSGSVGRPLIDTKIKIFDPELNELKINKIGEIGIKGPQVMKSYWHREELNKKVFTIDGYFLSGDLGYLDEHGRIVIVDRVKDMVIVSGFNVYPCNVEQVLDQHPDVLESACVGIDHKVSGQTIKAFVVKKPDSTLKKKSLINHCKKHLAHYKIPKKIEWVESLPKSTDGKIIKRLLNN